MQFERLTAAHRELIAPFFEGLLSRTCDLTVGTVLMWREVNRTEFCIEEGSLFLRLVGFSGRECYFLPFGGDLPSAVRRLKAAVSGPVRLVSVPKEYLPVLRAIDGEFLVEENRDYFDYLYRAEDLKTLSGKKYAKKRNLISQFDRAYPQAEVRIIDEATRAEVLSFFHRLMATLGEGETAVERLEREGCECVLTDPALCGMQGISLCVNGETVGFSLGEVLGDTLFTHIEKADRAYKGVYQKLTNTFVNTFAVEGVLHVNREDDAGDEGLRRAKLDYHPECLLGKYTVTL